VQSRIRCAIDGAVSATTFLTIVPLRTREGRGGGDGAAWFGVVGALIGAFAGAVYAGTQPLLGAPVAAALAVTGMVVITGGLHHDGLADCADGMGVRGDAARRLTVMREPSVGAYGVLALLLWGLLLTASVASFPPRDAVWALVCAASVGRFSALLHARWTRPARRDGLGASFAPSLVALLVAALTATAVAVLASLERAAVVIVAAGLCAALVSTAGRRFLGGRTGDTLGATVVLTELVVVLVLLASPPSASS
jgi:adenosylcobinamide-GDP ribazoletransferase